MSEIITPSVWYGINRDVVGIEVTGLIRQFNAILKDTDSFQWQADHEVGIILKMPKDEITRDSAEMEFRRRADLAGWVITRGFSEGEQRVGFKVRPKYGWRSP
jgi:O-methyltransferase involved in polyketide biosynthesis